MGVLNFDCNLIHIRRLFECTSQRTMEIFWIVVCECCVKAQMMGKAVVDFVGSQGAKNEHSHSYVSLFATQRSRKRYPGLAVI